MRRRQALALLAAWPSLAAAQPPHAELPAALWPHALTLLGQAASHGLAPREGLLDLLRGRAEAGDPELGVVLWAALRLHLLELHQGRVDPAALGQRYGAGRPPFDADAALRAAVALQDLDAAVHSATPPLAQYAQLRAALARMRALLGHPAWAQALPPLPGRRAGPDWAGQALLIERLRVLGDLEAGSEDLAAGLRRFQQRHGLEEDGRLGPASWSALQVAPERRLRQIELSLERLRWTPLLAAPRMVLINVPEFRLRAYAVDGERPRLAAEMRVIVGQALDTRTPLFQEEMRLIEFRPYWNVPDSIARKELLPRLRREPAYWAREGFEFVGPQGVEAGLSAAALQAVQQGRLRIRQRPGPRNALGEIKFVFPNRDAVYLHHTPSRGLFARSRRDLSHGCIRVEDPLALAEFVLQGQAGWDRARIRASMASGEPPRLRLQTPVTVLISYATALVKGGRLHFFEDLYGQDALLERALAQTGPSTRIE